MKLKYMLGKAYAIHLRTFNNFRRLNGYEDSLYSAESYVYLGKICQYLSKYEVILYIYKTIIYLRLVYNF